MILEVFLLVLAFMQLGIESMDCSISVKLKISEDASVVDTKLFYGRGWINIAMRTLELQYRQYLTGRILPLLLELEAIILRATEPPYNVQIPTER